MNNPYRNGYTDALERVRLHLDSLLNIGSDPPPKPKRYRPMTPKEMAAHYGELFCHRSIDQWEVCTVDTEHVGAVCRQYKQPKFCRYSYQQLFDDAVWVDGGGPCRTEVTDDE